ncbi:hypothetical protein ALNOE001_03390 [Candidatus Methanobinarius endosymbioticus]|uniref:Uncharacterized protein n=1 Tax=Candidatus Methanobinarius endosymbioticus TaxID=2006182 RepID=A0A366MDA1_9EURY|nr:hypothetical protein ALNOE001_03390 [Candidatus Methanobinarius endosymbioticus]
MILINHIIEVGESLRNVVKRLLNNDMSVEEVMEKTGLPEDYVLKIKNK